MQKCMHAGCARLAPEASVCVCVCCGIGGGGGIVFMLVLVERASVCGCDLGGAG